MSIIQLISFFGTAIICIAYALLIGSFTIGWFRLPLVSSSLQPPSTIATIIIAARNEEVNLGNCLRAIAAQDYPKTLFEVIVVDDHSTDGTIELVRKIISEYPSLKIKLLELGDGMEGKKNAISQAINSAIGEWIVTTDADCRMYKQWISSLMQYAPDKSLQMLLAPVVFKREKSIFGQLQELEFLSLQASTAGAAGMGLPIMCNGANLAYRKNTFLEINGYLGNKHFASGDDMFLMMKIRKTYGSRSIRFVKSISAIVTTSAASNFSGFINQRLRWVSKSSGYRDAWVIMTSVVVYAFSLGTIISVLAWAFGYAEPLVPVTFLSVKLLVDFPLMAACTRFVNRSHLMLWYIPLQFIYLVYVTIIGALGNLIKYSWKGRELH